MKRGYLLLAHADVNLLKRLIDSLNYSNKNYFFIHIDKKVNIDIFLEKFLDYPNVYLIDKRESISWGGFSMVEAMLNLLECAISSQIDFSHLVFLSGNDYPIKKQKQIEEFFNNNLGKQIIRGFSISNSNCDHCNDKINRKWYFDSEIKNKLLRKIKIEISNRLPQVKKNRNLYVEGVLMDIIFGSQWFAITQEAAEYIIETSKKYPQIKKFFKNTLAPDEMFFHTILFNSHFKDSTVKGEIEAYSPIWKWNNYTWLDSSELNCSTKSHRGIINIFQKIYSNVFKHDKKEGTLPFLQEDYYEVLKETNLIFARKLNSEYSEKLLEKIDEMRK